MLSLAATELTHCIAIAIDAIAVRAHHVVLFAAFAIRSVTVALAIQTMATVAGLIVQMPVEETLVGMAVAVAGYATREMEKHIGFE